MEASQSEADAEKGNRNTGINRIGTDERSVARMSNHGTIVGYQIILMVGN